MNKNLFFVISLALTLFLSSCNGQYRDGADYNPTYKEVLSKWTKNTRIYSNSNSETIIVDATYKSDEFRSAFVKEYSKIYGLNRKVSNKKTVYSEIISNSKDDDKYLEFFVSLYTPNPSWNDLDKKNSIWDVYIETSDGKQIPATTIVKSDKEDARTVKFYPYIGPWSKAYVLKFPVSKIVDTKSLHLTFYSVKGEVNLVWDNSPASISSKDK